MSMRAPDGCAGLWEAWKMKRRAKHRRIAHTGNECDCLVCRERGQLHDAAQWNPHMPIRVAAMTFLGAMDSVHEGRLGSMAIEDLFD
jgi:hypothetical protein